jgi:hypothetical protein
MKAYKIIDQMSKQDKIIQFMSKNNITLLDVMEAVISNNGIIGVGLISLQNAINDFLTDKRIK